MSGSDSFGTFLESFESAKGKAETESASRTLPLQIKILHLLGDGKRRRVMDLMQEGKIDFQAYAAALTALKGADLVELVGEAGEEEVEATPQGLELAHLDA